MRNFGVNNCDMVTLPKILSVHFPELAKEWDYEKNYPLKPEDVTIGSNKIVYWICPICKLSYPAKICNRTAPSKRKKTNKCPICLGHIIIPGYNSLKAKFPQVVSDEWDYERNSIDPDTIAPHQNKKYWWKCPNGHSYEASVNNKTSKTGGNCPYCSHQRLAPEFSLAIANPELAKEWDHSKNTKTPADVFVNSNTYAWWRCAQGHEWRAKICNRHNGRGCPECSKGRSTSFPEQAIYHFVHNVFADAISGYKHNGIEIDVYIPSLKMGIEYDGSFYHKTKQKVAKDVAKNIKLNSDGIHLIRIRENGCYAMTDTHCIIYNYAYTSDYKSLNEVIVEVLTYICENAGITYDSVVSIEDVRNKILKDIAVIPKGQDLASCNPILAQDWDYDRNYPLTPHMVKPGSDKRLYWICAKCGYKWDAIISSRNRGSGCAKCSNRQRYTTQEWIETARKVHGTKYDYSKVDYHNSETPVIIICPIHGEFTQLPSEHLSGKGCRFCAGQAFHKSEVLSQIYPHLVDEWDYEKNLAEYGITPETAFVRKRTKFFWHCNFGKPHSYKASIQDRVKRNMQCCVCHGKQSSIDRSVGFLYPQLAAEWCSENDKSPYEVSPGSEYIALWKCANPNHEPYKQMVYNRCHLNTQCQYCSGNKKHPKDYELELKQIHPNIKIIKPFIKSSVRIDCECIKCGHKWSPYPYSLLKSKGCPKCR